MSTYSIDRPMLIYEALELLRAYVSGIPLERVVGSGPYCIPSEAAEKIMAQCCGHLSPEDEELQFYFKTHPMEEAPVNATCVARILLYFHIQLGQAEDYFDFLKGAWGTLRQIQHCFHGIDGFSLDIKSTGKDGRTNLACQIQELPITREYSLQLLDAMYDYAYHLERLRTILTPVMNNLEPLLQPWLEQARPWLEEWKSFLDAVSLKEFLRQRGSVDDGTAYETLIFAPRFFDAQISPGGTSQESKTVSVLMGVGVPAGMERPAARGQMSEESYGAFRLLSDRGRMDILRATSIRPMRMQDLVTHLHLNPGTVSRNLNSLYSEGLLIRETIKGRFWYETNQNVLHTVLRQAREYMSGDE